MASSSPKHLLPFLLLTLLSSLHIAHARDSQFFDKLPTVTNTVPPEEQPHDEQQQQQQQQQPFFVPENDNAYGLYGQESDNVTPSNTFAATNTVPPEEQSQNEQQQQPVFVPEKDNANALYGQESDVTPSNSFSETATFPDEMESKQPLNTYRPKNYNPVAYVTQPEDTTDSPSTTNYENIGKEDSSFNSDSLSGEKNFNNGGTNGYQPQGMSDTRSLESGKYFYDVNSEKYSNNHPYTRLSGVRERNEYSESENAYDDQFNGESTIGGYSNQDDFQDEEDNDLP